MPLLGEDQQRNQGGKLHEAVCQTLGLPQSRDDGQLPDVPEQLLEIKLQTAPTIDLGLVLPDGTGRISGMPDYQHCDVRYAVFYGEVRGDQVTLTHLILTTGRDFFKFFDLSEGKMVNKKLQIRLPTGFFDAR